MSIPSPSACIIRSLQIGEMAADLPASLLSVKDRRVRHRNETKLWDYKQELPLQEKADVAEFARDVLAFHNTEGGAIVAGVSNHYRITGIPTALALDTKRLRDKLRPYAGDDIELFQDSVDLKDNTCVWIIFVPKNPGAPRVILQDAPIGKGGKRSFVKGDIFFRDHDETRKCVSENDYQRLFIGFSSQHLVAYNYEIDEPYFRLLNANCEQFIGRKEQLQEVRDALNSRHPIVTLDGLGGVGKTAIAIEVAHQLYLEQKCCFIFSISAKSEIWHGQAMPMRPGFSSLPGFLKEFAALCQLKECGEDTETLKLSVVNFMKGLDGLIVVDNLEQITDVNLFTFLSLEVPEPVKILVTSRIDKDFGGLKKSIPAMTENESKELLIYEMERLGYVPQQRDEGSIQEMVSRAGGLPLALKWMAQIAADRRSAGSAAVSIAVPDLTQKSLLSFCFETMYGNLGETAKEAACLLPYLGLEWRASTLSIVLDIPLDSAWAAILEVSDKGLTYNLRGPGTDGYGALPLTKEFLSLKWNGNHSLRRRVDDRLTDMFTSSSAEGWLLDWPLEQRMEFLLQEIPRRIANHDFDKALKLQKLAMGWRPDPILLFLEGRIRFETGSRDAGLSLMRLSRSRDVNGSVLSCTDLILLARALFSMGENQFETEACRCVIESAKIGGDISEELADNFIRCTNKKLDYKDIVAFLDSLKDERLLDYVCKRLMSLLLDSAFLAKYHDQIGRIMTKLSNSVTIGEESKRSYIPVSEKLSSLENF